MTDHRVPHPFGRLAAALAYPNFRILWAGAFTSSIGTWMQSVAQSWLVLTLTGSAFYLGLDAFLGQFPVMLFALLGGVVADRYDRRRILLVSQAIQLVSAFSLAVLVALGAVRIWHILALSFMTGTAQAFGGPAYQSLLPSLVDRRDLPAAIAFNSVQFNLARVIGPLAAGLALAAFGSAACFGLNGVSYLAVVVALLMVRLPRAVPPPPRPVRQELAEGLAYVRHEPSLISYMVLAFVTTSLGTSVLTLLPLLVKQVFGGGAGDYSRMMAFSGAGAVVGALASAVLGRYRQMGRTALAVLAALGGLIVAFALSRVALTSHVLLFFIGAALLVVHSALISTVQLVASDQMRGRVMSIYLMAFRGGMPIGALASGYVATLTSAPAALALNGALLIVAAAIGLRRAPRPDVFG